MLPGHWEGKNVAMGGGVSFLKKQNGLHPYNRFCIPVSLGIFLNLRFSSFGMSLNCDNRQHFILDVSDFQEFYINSRIIKSVLSLGSRSGFSIRDAILGL